MRVGRGAVVRGAILDKNVVVPDGALVGVDLATDRARYTVSQGGVVVLGKGVTALVVARRDVLTAASRPVAQRQQHRGQPVVVADLPGHLAQRERVLGVGGVRVERRPRPSTPSSATHPARAQQPHAPRRGSAGSRSGSASTNTRS